MSNNSSESVFYGPLLSVQYYQSQRKLIFSDNGNHTREYKRNFSFVTIGLLVSSLPKNTILEEASLSVDDFRSSPRASNSLYLGQRIAGLLAPKSPPTLWALSIFIIEP
jgi:hypothetical protein